jgi:hypothetical protein
MAYVYVCMYIDISENAIYMYIIYEQLDDMIKDTKSATRIFDMIT